MQRGIVYFLLFVIAVVAAVLSWWPYTEPIDPVLWSEPGGNVQGSGDAEPGNQPAGNAAALSRPRTTAWPSSQALGNGGQEPLSAEGGPVPVADAPSLAAGDAAVVAQGTAVRPADRSGINLVHVHVEVVDKERFVPPPPVRAEAVLLSTGKPLPTTLIAGVGAGFDAPPGAAGNSLAAIEVGGNTLLRQVALVAGEVVKPTLGGPIVVSGSIRDRQGRPVIGASVWFGELLADGSRREVTTIEDGAFTAEVLAGSGVPFVVRKAGFAALWRPIQVTAPMGPCDAVLQPACTLDVQLVGAAIEMQDARVFVLPQAPVASELTSWPFFQQALQDGYALDERGRASIPELPHAGTLGVVVRHPHSRQREAVAAPLKGDRARVQVPMQFAKEGWDGRIVGQDGEPLGGVAMWSRQLRNSIAPGGSQRLLPPHLEAVGTYASRSRADGTFAIAADPGGVLSLRATGYAGRNVPVADLGRGRELVLPRWVGGEVQFTLLPPAPGVAWHASTNLSGALQADLAADEAWRVSLPHAGRYDLLVTTRLGDAVPAARSYSDVMVTGPIEVASPSANR